MPSITLEAALALVPAHLPIALVKIDAQGVDYKLIHATPPRLSARGANIMLTIDLLSGKAFQRCWDQQCIRPNASGRGYTKARHYVGVAPMESLPAETALQDLESR